MFRRGQMRDLTITVAEVEPDEAQVARAEGKSSPGATATAKQIGLVVVDLTEAQKKSLAIKGGVRADFFWGFGADAGAQLLPGAARARSGP